MMIDPCIFTPGQRRQLQQLLAAGAVDQQTAKGRDHAAMAGCSPQVIARLRALGLAQRQIVETGPLQRATLYWLSEAGVQAARDLR